MKFILFSFSRSAYTFIYCLLLPFFLLRLYIRSLNVPDYRKRVSERLGFLKNPDLSAFKKKPIIIHAVSVGENIAVLPVIKRLLESEKDTPIVVTCTTPTGSAQIKKSLAHEIEEGRVFHLYLPYDVPIFISRFFTHINPRLILMVETELWPNTLAFCKNNNIKTALINARLSEKSFNAYAKLNTIVGEMLNNVDLILAQDESSAQRFIKLGMPSENIMIVGNIKFDFNLNISMHENASMYKKIFQGRQESSLLIAASTHKGEDEIVLKAFSLLLDQYKDSDVLPRLIIVPRHLERFSSVKSLSESFEFKTKFLSELMKNREASNKDMQVIVVDEIGLLATLFGVADVALVCGSLMSSLGGHNLIEPAAWGIPVLSGPNLSNFQKIADELVAKKALKLVNSAEDLMLIWQMYLSNDVLRFKAGDAAKKYQLENQGAVEKTLHELLERF